MREIKFRAWDKKQQQYILDYTKILPVHYNGSLERPHLGVYVLDADETDCDIQLYTGLKDKNGKEIYEGDIILTYIRVKKKDTGKIAEVYDKKETVSRGIWCDDEYGYEIHTWLLGEQYLSEYKKYDNPYWDAITERYEIIGNIHENPELLL